MHVRFGGLWKIVDDVWRAEARGGATIDFTKLRLTKTWQPAETASDFAMGLCQSFHVTLHTAINIIHTSHGSVQEILRQRRLYCKNTILDHPTPDADTR